MAHIDSLIDKITDPALRDAIAAELAQANKTKKFGLVFERHLPESVETPGVRPRNGDQVRFKGADKARFRVLATKGAEATVIGLTDEDALPEKVDIDQLIVVRDFNEPVYAGLKHLGGIHRGGGKPSHTVIRGENYHALEAMLYTDEGTIDVIYIDPPYNTGAGDWIYNDKYVDSSDAYGHSKWLSFIERRLRHAKRLLKDTGVVILAIDDNEHARLKLLCDEVFGEQNFISNVVWNGARKNDERFVSNGADYMLIYGKSKSALGDAGTKWREEKEGVQDVLDAGARIWDESLLEALFADPVAKERHDFYLHQRTFETVHPELTAEWRSIWISNLSTEQNRQLRELAGEIGHGKMLSWFKSQPKDSPSQAMARNTYFLPDGALARDTDITWPGGGGPRFDVLHPLTNLPVPIPPAGWRYSTTERMQQAIDAGEVIFKQDHTKPISLKKRLEDVTGQVPISVFERQRTHATRHLAAVLSSKDFPYPKDVDVVARWVNIVSANNPDAVILDFFGGTGTTTEAVMRLNSQDGGRRRSILVTNNELAAATSKKLAKAGVQPGDPEWESEGVFEKVTRPRIETVVSGIRRDGSKYSDGLDENVEFFELTYEDEKLVQLGRKFKAVAPLLWMKAGARGTVIDEINEQTGFTIGDGYAVLFNVDRSRQFLDALPETVDNVFVVADSSASAQTVASALPPHVKVWRLYDNYLSSFRINTVTTAPDTAPTNIFNSAADVELVA